MQSILNLKEKLEEQEKNNYAMKQATYMSELNQQRQMELKQGKYEDRLRELMRDTLDIESMRHVKEGIESLKQLILIQKDRVAKAEQALKLAQVKLEQAMIERKTQEKLREKQFKLYVSELNNEEKKEIDELISFRYMHNQSTPK